MLRCIPHGSERTINTLDQRVTLARGIWPHYTPNDYIRVRPTRVKSRVRPTREAHACGPRVRPTRVNQCIRLSRVLMAHARRAYATRVGHVHTQAYVTRVDHR